MKKYLLTFLCSMFATQVNANSLAVYQLESDQTYIQAPLEHSIYFYSSDPHLSDVSVQDSQGNNLPFRIVDVPKKSREILHKTTIPFFPIAPDTSTEILHTLSSTRIEIRSDQVQVDIKPDIQTIQENTEPPEFYLLDLQSIQKRAADEKDLALNALILDWDKPQDQYQTWALSGSNDLRNWQFIRNGSLVRLEKEGYQLLQNRIDLEFGPDKFAYLKLACVEFCSNLRITQVTLEEKSKQTFTPETMKWSLTGTPVSGKAIKLSETDDWRADAIWEFAREDRAPADRLKIDFAQQIFGNKLRLLAKNREQDAWSLVYQGIWFNSRVGTEWRSSSSISLNHQWKYFRVELGSEVPSDFVPKLVFEAEPRLVQFVGNNNSPYRLVIQSANVAQSQLAILDSLLKDYSPTWHFLEWQFLNPPFPDRAMVVSWRSLVLWGCIILAVILLAGMAIKLSRQMNAAASPGSDGGYKK